MILALIKRALKGALHEAVEEWTEEVGLPHVAVAEMRAQRLARVEKEAARADARAAAALGAEDGDDPPALPMRPAVRLTAAPAAAGDGCPDEEGLMDWVHGRRRAGVAWAEVARLAAEKGQPLGEEALRGRYRRWLRQNGQDGHTRPG